MLDMLQAICPAEKIHVGFGEYSAHDPKKWRHLAIFSPGCAYYSLDADEENWWQETSQSEAAPESHYTMRDLRPRSNYRNSNYV